MPKIPPDFVQNRLASRPEHLAEEFVARRILSYLGHSAGARKTLLWTVKETAGKDADITEWDVARIALHLGAKPQCTLYPTAGSGLEQEALQKAREAWPSRESLQFYHPVLFFRGIQDIVYTFMTLVHTEVPVMVNAPYTVFTHVEQMVIVKQRLDGFMTNPKWNWESAKDLSSYR